MATNRPEPGKEAADKAEKPANPSAASSTASGGGFKAWLPLLATILVMPMAAYAVTTLVLVPKLQHSLGVSEPAHPGNGSESSKSGKEPEAKRDAVAMNKLLANVAGTAASRYLMTSFTVSGVGAEFRPKIERNDARLRDAAGTVLSGKTLADLERPGARNLIRSELISAFNTILGANTVQEIYFTEFAVQ
jgi:flagellar basal body-associated protein FliL